LYNKITTARTVKDNFNLDCSVRNFQRFIAATPSIKMKILKRKPMLKPVNIFGRLAFGKVINGKVSSLAMKKGFAYMSQMDSTIIFMTYGKWSYSM